MSYNYNQRKSNIKKCLRNGFIEVNGVKKMFRMVNGRWKLVDYVEPMTSI